MRRLLLFLFICSLSINCWAQTQQGVVKTKGRMVNGMHVAGHGLSGATVTIQGRSAVLSQANGAFSFPIPSKTFMLQGVQKNGYQLVDLDATRKAYQYSPNTFYIVMETPDQQSEDKLTAERKIRRTLQRQLQQREDELEELKAQYKLTQEEYRKAMQQLYDDQQNNEKLIADMAKEYAEMDYDQMDELNRQISDFILNGELVKADSLLRSKGDMNSRDAEITRRLEAEAKRKEEIAREQKELAASEKGTCQLLEDFAKDCYNYFSMYKLENKHDSAAYYIELRANRDTTNAEWQLDAAQYLHEQKQFQKAQLLYDRAIALLRVLATSNPEAYDPLVASTLNSLAILYSKTQHLLKSEMMHMEALSIYHRLANDYPQMYEAGLAITQNYIANIYSETLRYEEAEKLYHSALAIFQRLVISEPDAYEPDVARIQNDLATLQSRDFGNEWTEQLYLSALEIYQRLATTNPEAYEHNVAEVQNNMANLYLTMNWWSDKEYLNEAEKMYLLALETYQRLALSNPEKYESDVATTQYNLATLYSHTQRSEEAERMYLSALEIRQLLSASNPDAYEKDVANTQYKLAILYKNAQRYAESFHSICEAIITLKKVATSNPSERKTYGYALHDLMELYQQHSEECEADEEKIKLILNEISPSSENTLENFSEWYPLGNSVNPDLIKVADVLYSINPQTENDQNNIYDYGVQLVWYKKCKEAIYSYFDSRYSLLDFNYTKEHTVICELQAFFSESEEQTTIGLGQNLGLKICILTFLSLYIQNDELGCSKQEIHAWNQLHKILDETVKEKLIKEFDGGSFAAIAVGHRFIDILNARIEYLQDVKGYNLEMNVESVYSLEEARQQFFTRIDNTEIPLSMKRQLKMALNNWLSETKCENCISRFISKLTDAFDEYDLWN